MAAGTALSGLPIRVPGDATEVTTDGPRPFVTRVRYVRSDGRVVHWQARAHRKVHGRGLTWWTALLFAVGSACFVVGPLPAVLDERAANDGGRLAYRFLVDGEESERLLHHGELMRQARLRQCWQAPPPLRFREPPPISLLPRFPRREAVRCVGRR